MSGRMELTVTTSPTPATALTLRDRLRRLFGGELADGRIGAKVNASRALDLVKDGATLVDVRENN